MVSYAGLWYTGAGLRFNRVQQSLNTVRVDAMREGQVTEHSSEGHDEIEKAAGSLLGCPIPKSYRMRNKKEE